MKKILYLTWIISLCLIVYLAIEQTYRFDVFSTKNEHLLDNNKAKINENARYCGSKRVFQKNA